MRFVSVLVAVAASVPAAFAVFPDNTETGFTQVGMCGDWNGSSFTQWGTGVAVAPGWVLTARHVGGTHFFQNGVYYSVLQKIHHSATLSADLSLWKLASPVPAWGPISYRPFSGANGIQGLTGTLVGYGVTANLLVNSWGLISGTNGTKRRSVNNYDRLETGITVNFGTFTRTTDYLEYDLDDPTGNNTRNTMGGTAIPGEGGIADKDSGSPWFVLDGGLQKVCALSSIVTAPSGVATPYHWGGYGGGTFLASYKSWIQTTAPELGTMTATLDSATARPTLVSGSVAQLAATDGQFFRSRSYNLGFADYVSAVGALVGFTTTVVFPTTLDITLDAKTDGGMGIARVFVRNWTTGGFDQVDSYTVTGTVTRRDTLNVSAANHVRASDGRIEVWTDHSSFSADMEFVDCYLDFAKVVAKT